MADQLPPDEIVERIRKLLALSSSSNANEAAVAAAKAADLLQRYNLEMHQIEQKTNTGSAVIDLQEWVDEDKKDGIKFKERWVLQLANTLCNHFMCKAVVGRGRLHFIGTQVNAESAHQAFLSLRISLLAMSQSGMEAYAKKLKQTMLDNPEEFADVFEMSPYSVKGSLNPLVWKRSWLLGAVEGIDEQLDQQSDNATSDVKAMVLVSNTKVNDYLREHYGRMGKYQFSSNNQHSAAGRMAGQVAGRNLSIAGQRKLLK